MPKGWIGEIMGSYLEINNRETNSKALSGILIDAIRDIDSEIMNNENSTDKERKYFIPEYYKKTENEEFGCGDWTINKKGMALLVSYLKNMCEDDKAARSISIEEHEYFLKHLVKENEREEKIAEFAEEARDDIQWCFYYATDILTEMVLYGIKRVGARWV